jgi:hypothetical protein
MKKWTMGLLAMCSLLLLANDYTEEKIINDFGKLFKLETFEYQGEKILSVGIVQTSDSEYGDLLKQLYPYLLMINQLAETHKMCAALKELTPAEAEETLQKQLRSLPFLKKELLPLMARYLKAKGQSVQVILGPRPTYDIKALMPIAARFFYPHLVNDEFKIHICVGINGLHTLNPEPPSSLVAFSYHAIHTDQPEMLEFISFIRKTREEKKDEDIQILQKTVWDWLEKNQKLKNLLINKYNLIKDTLPFILEVGENTK